MTTTTFNLAEYARAAYAASKSKGWWEIEEPLKTYLMGIVSELGEALNADRENKYADVEAFKKRMYEIESSFNKIANTDTDAYLLSVFAEKYKMHIKGCVEEELADAAIRILVLLGRQEEDSIEPDLLNYYQLDFNNYTDSQRDKPLPVQLFRLTSFAVRSLQHQTYLPFCLKSIFTIAEGHKIDLLWHIDAKMRFNTTTPPKSGGKKY